jgi:nicotinate-nucleotide adenylyltransferase
MSGSRTVALLGGSFDPPHIGHVLMASWALCVEEVQEVWLLPTFIHPFGKALSAYETRCEMCEGAIAHLGPTARVERIEQELGGVSYTVRTLEALSRREPDVSWRWVGGADTWNHPHRSRAPQSCRTSRAARCGRESPRETRLEAWFPWRFIS